MNRGEIPEPKITCMSYWFSSDPVLRAELLSSFSNVTFQDEPRVREPDELIRHLQGSRGMILGADDVNAQVLSGLPELEIVSVFGVGMENLDADSARSQGIRVGWAAGVNKASVAEQTLALMIGLCRKLFVNYTALKAGEWREEDAGTDLSGKTVGIVGGGSSGCEVLRVLQPFGCPALVVDSEDVTARIAPYDARQVDLRTLLTHADLVSVHVPLTDATRGLIGRAQLQLMKSSAYLVNTSRGAVVDQQALGEALRIGQIAGAALDVFDPEPPTDEDFIALENLIVTPHTAGGSHDAVLAMGRAAIAHLVRHFAPTPESDDQEEPHRPSQGGRILHSEDAQRPTPRE